MHREPLNRAGQWAFAGVSLASLLIHAFYSQAVGEFFALLAKIAHRA